MKTVTKTGCSRREGKRNVRGHRTKQRLSAMICVVALVSTFAACGSSAKTSSSTAAGTSAPATTAAGASGTSATTGTKSTASGTTGTTGSGGFLASAAKATAVASTKPASIRATEKYTPKKGLLFFNVTCNLASVGCAEISQEIGVASRAMGEKFKACNAGTTATQAAGCFVNAVNAHASAIIVNDVPKIASGNGYAEAAAAHIPIFGAFTGNPIHTPDEPTQAAENASQQEAELLADYIITTTKGKANVLYIAENQDEDGVQRTQGFDSTMSKCKTCSVDNIQVNEFTETTSGPPAISAALEAHPSIDWVVGNSDNVSVIAVSVVEQLAKTHTISVAGMDADPQDIQYMKEGRVQKLDATVGQGEVAFAAVNAAGLYVSGHSVPLSTPVNIWLIDPKNVSEIPSTGVFFGPTNYQQQFEALWKG